MLITHYYLSIYPSMSLSHTQKHAKDVTQTSFSSVVEDVHFELFELNLIGLFGFCQSELSVTPVI